MSNTSNNKAANSKPTKNKDKDKLRVIVGEIGRDSKTGILGRGYSPDNGKTFHVTETMYGRLYNGNDIDAIWNNGTSEKVKSEVNSATAEIPAVKSAADEAVKKADSAIASSKVNSDAIVAQSEAISEAKVAMDSATAEIQQTASNAASDAAKIRADVAQVQNEVDTAKAANSASVEALKSDVSAAKQDLADVHDSLTKAQAAAEESQKAIDNSIAQINSDIEQDRKDIDSAQQANADTAKQLDTYSKQAQAQGKTIKSIQDKQDGFTATLADAQGNVTQMSDKVDGLSASLKDAQGNVASIKAQADQLSATLTDHAKSIATLTASAKELSSTLEDADGRLSKVEQTAQTNSSTLSDVQGDLSQVKQDATTLTATLKDAQGNISTLQQKADSVSAQLASAQGDIASLQTDVTGIKATLVSHEGDIHTLQADSKTLKDDMQDAQGDISTLKKTSTDVTSELKDHDGRISKVEQTASTLTNEFSDQDGRLSKVEQTATGTQQTVANQQGQINDIKTDISGVHETITEQGNQIATINTSLNGLNTKYESVSGDLGKLKSQAQWATVTSAVDLNNVKTPCHEFLKGTVTNAPNEVAWWYLTVEGSESGRITQTVIADQSNNRYTRRWADGWSAWVKDATQTDVTALSNRITTNSTQITQNKSAIALKADQTVVDAVKNTASQNSSRLDVMNNEIKSKVSSTDVNDIVNSKGYVTTSTVQSLVDQKAGTLNESITNLSTELKNNSGGGVNLLLNSGTLQFSANVTSRSNNPNSGDSLWHLSVGSLADWLKDNPTVTKLGISYDYELTGTTKASGIIRFGVNQAPAWEYISGYNLDGKPLKGRAKTIIDVTNDMRNSHTDITRIRGDGLPIGATLKITHPKWEIGAVTPYSQAPSDNATVTQVQSLTASIDGLQSTVANKADTSQITQLSNLIQSKVSSNDFTSKISQLSNDINARVSKGDLMSQINIEAGQTLIQSNKLFLDADTIVFSKNSKAFIPDAAIENLSLDKLTTGHITVPIVDKYGNQIELGNDGINVSSALEPIDWSGSGTGYQDDKSRFNFNVSSHGMSFTNHIEYGKSTVKTHASDDYQFLNLTPDVLHYTNGSTDQVKVPSGMTMYVPVNATSTLGPESPGGFFAIGHEQIGDNGATSDKTIDIAYVAKQINGWKQGLHVNTTIYSKPAGASHNMRTAWVSWSQWDAGEHYPAIISDGKWWGGICFPSTGKVILFDPYGHAMWLTQGNAPYSAWGDDYYS